MSQDKHVTFSSPNSFSENIQNSHTCCKDIFANMTLCKEENNIRSIQLESLKDGIADLKKEYYALFTENISLRKKHQYSSEFHQDALNKSKEVEEKLNSLKEKNLEAHQNLKSLNDMFGHFESDLSKSQGQLQRLKGILENNDTFYDKQIDYLEKERKNMEEYLKSIQNSNKQEEEKQKIKYEQTIDAKSKLLSELSDIRQEIKEKTDCLKLIEDERNKIEPIKRALCEKEDNLAKIEDCVILRQKIAVSQKNIEMLNVHLQQHVLNQEMCKISEVKEAIPILQKLHLDDKISVIEATRQNLSKKKITLAEAIANVDGEINESEILVNSLKSSYQNYSVQLEEMKKKEFDDSIFQKEVQLKKILGKIDESVNTHTPTELEKYNKELEALKNDLTDIFSKVELDKVKHVELMAALDQEDPKEKMANDMCLELGSNIDKLKQDTKILESEIYLLQKHLSPEDSQKEDVPKAKRAKTKRVAEKPRPMEDREESFCLSDLD